MNILVATSEAAPFAKTGGLADVCGVLPIELARRGHEAAVILPAFRQTRQAGIPLEPTNLRFDIPIGNKIVSGRLLESRFPGSEVPVYLVEQNDYFDRPELYREGGEDYKDNCERFVFFSRAVMEAIRLLRRPVQVIHANDWQTALIPAYLQLEYRHTHGYEDIASVFTIHNMAYQGQFWHWDMLLTGLDWKYFNWRQLEYYGGLNLLKAGVVFADTITTVSPTYAREIQTGEFGCGLEGVLASRAADLYGVLNGVDYGEWDPKQDPRLPVNFGVSNWAHGKAACKMALQREVGLPTRPEAPLLGFVGRLADQKGLDLLEPVVRQWAAEEDAQWVFLGSGEPRYQSVITALSQYCPHKVAVRIGFNNDLAHRIEAGCDIFVMPSRYEPCGLNQMYSLRYGAVPVVRTTGGLADTITDAAPEKVEAGLANGFSFQDYSPAALDNTLRRACETYRHQPKTWEQIVVTGMKQDWSWARSADTYLEIYAKTLAKHLARDPALA
ncbi:MAG: glycogen synthase GlgA [Planctomycetes bacterium]|nr:glycogen synthase GlgA [Planctomycetota bacterium]